MTEVDYNGRYETPVGVFGKAKDLAAGPQDVGHACVTTGCRGFSMPTICAPRKGSKWSCHKLPWEYDLNCHSLLWFIDSWMANAFLINNNDYDNNLVI